jgi:hypothetical protein
MVGATLSAAIMAAVLSSYIYMGRSLARLANQQTLETEARRTLGYFTQDVQSATGLADTANLSATRVSLSVPSSTGTNTITYYYNGTSADTSVAVGSATINMAANALTRCVDNGSTVTSQLLLRNITTNGLALKYYDASGKVYTSYVNYLPGIKQLVLQFSTQAGVGGNGTQTQVYQVSSGRLALRNDALLQ